MKSVDPVPCQHIADYYNHRQEENPSLGNNLLRRGYQQFASGRIESYSVNNLFRPTIRISHENLAS